MVLSYASKSSNISSLEGAKLGFVNELVSNHRTKGVVVVSVTSIGIDVPCANWSSFGWVVTARRLATVTASDASFKLLEYVAVAVYTLGVSSTPDVVRDEFGISALFISLVESGNTPLDSKN